MILTNAYFIDEIFIPHAKPSVTDSVTNVDSELKNFIETYEKECLVKCLGYQLYKEFSQVVDIANPNGLVTLAALKWDWLLNGYEYTDSNGKLVMWKGVRQEKILAEGYNKSFLANYVYYFFEKSEDDDRVGVGNVKQKSENAETVSKTPKVVAAWRSFIKDVQGDFGTPKLITKTYGHGIDWYGSNHEKSLFDFINDMNAVDPLTYPNFNPSVFRNMNQFGI